jgi:hypothetical protein
LRTKYLAPLAALFCVANLYAQTPAPGYERVVYDAGFYAQFAPRTALDMINQTPGFVLRAPTGNELRGFSGAVGNVLVDGERLGAKTQSLTDVLGRVAAREVLRIEILRGAEVAGDASGAAVLANVVRTPTAGGGSWEGGIEVTNEHEPAPNGKFAWSGRREATEYSVGGSMYTHDHFSALRGVVRNGAGTPIENENGVYPHQTGEHALSGQVSSPVGDGELTITGHARLNRANEQFERRYTTTGGAQIEAERNPYRDRTRTGEAGVTYQQTVGDWDMNLTTLATRKRREYDATSLHFDAEDAQDRERRQRALQHSGESIARGTFARELERGRIEIGGEIAVNSLDGELVLTQDLGAGPVPIDVPNANLSVEENRGEAFVANVWRISRNWSLDSRLAAETSRLSFTGDTEKSASLTYVKPRVQLTRTLGTHQIQARVFREVGQLNFTDFVSSAQLADDLFNGGNPDLRPQTEWTVEVEADLRFADDTALRMRVFHNFLDDVVDFVPLGPSGARFDARANIGEGNIIGAEVSLRVPLRRVLPGGTLSIAGKWRDSEVTDPLTGEKRQISNFAENNVRVDLRQDLSAAKLAWGMKYEGWSHDADFRLTEIDRFRGLHRLDFFVETTALANLKMRIEMQNVLDGTEVRNRKFYAPDRNAALSSGERFYFYPGHYWLFSVSSSL